MSVWSVWGEHMIYVCVGIFLRMSEIAPHKNNECVLAQTDQTWTCTCFYSILHIIKS